MAVQLSVGRAAGRLTSGRWGCPPVNGLRHSGSNVRLVAGSPRCQGCPLMLSNRFNQRPSPCPVVVIVIGCYRLSGEASASAGLVFGAPATSGMLNAATSLLVRPNGDVQYNG